LWRGVRPSLSTALTPAASMESQFGIFDDEGVGKESMCAG